MFVQHKDAKGKDLGFVNLAHMTRLHFRKAHKYPVKTKRPEEPAHMVLTFSDGATIRTEDTKLMAAAQEFVDKNKA